jgi:hypothetical protein
MSDYRTATGFAARVREQSAPPPPRPSPSDEPAYEIDLTDTVETNTPPTDTAGDDERRRTPTRPTDRRRATRDAAAAAPPTSPPTRPTKAPAAPPADPVAGSGHDTTVSDASVGERPAPRGPRPVSLQLEGRHIAFIRDGARARRLFVNVWLRRLLTEEADRIAACEPIPAPPHAEGPDDFVFYRQFSARLAAETIERLDELSGEHAAGNRSHLVRVLLDRAEQRYDATEPTAAT